MEDWLWHIALLATGILAILFMISRLASRLDHRLPPSPRVLPLIGHLHLLLGKRLHHALANIAEEHGSCVRIKLGSYPHLVISSAEAAKEAIRVRDSTFSSLPPLSPAKIFGANTMSWAPYGEYWRAARKLCTMEILTMKQVELSRSARAEEMALVMAKILEASERMVAVELSQLISDATYSMILRKVVGESYLRSANAEAARFKNLVKELFSAIGALYVGDTIPWLGWLDFRKLGLAKQVHRQLEEYLQKQIVRHRNQAQGSVQDFMSILLQNHLSDTCIRALSLEMISGGTETSAVAIEWAMSELINNPEVMSRLQEELFGVFGSSAQVDEDQIDKLVYLSAVVKETLRLHAPDAVLTFQAKENCQVMGYFVPRRTRVLINTYKISRDESYWEDPLTFKPERFLERDIDISGIRNFEMLPFGSGRKHCPGMQLGLRLVKFILASLVHGFEWKNLTKTRLDMSEGTSTSTPRAVPLMLIPVSKLQ